MKELVEALALIEERLLGRGEVSPSVLEDVSSRLEQVTASLQKIDDGVLDQTPLGLSWDPQSPWARMPAALGPEELSLLGEKGTGYTPREPREQGLGRGSQEQGSLVITDEISSLSLTQVLALVRNKELSPVELVNRSLSLIERTEPALNAFVFRRDEEAVAEAEALASEATRGSLRPLHGLPVAIKDVFDVAGLETTGGSKTRAGRRAERDAEAVRLLKEAGCVVIGKTNTHEAAFGVTTDSPFFGPVHNPRDLSRTAGGSSGGSAAAVASGVVPLALGTDTGGSVRIPAACCGVWGYKPLFGTVSVEGVLPLSWSLDHVGTIACDFEGAMVAARLLQRKAGPLSPPSLQGLKLGIPGEWVEQAEQGVKERFFAGEEELEKQGAKRTEVSLPPPQAMSFVNRVITLAEAGAFHAPMLKTRADDYGPDVRARLELGLALGARDYLLAQRLRLECTRMLWRTMQEADLLLTPTIPISPPLLGEQTRVLGKGVSQVPDALILFTAPFSLVGFPAASFALAEVLPGLPGSLQAVAPPGREELLLSVGNALGSPGRER